MTCKIKVNRKLFLTNASHEFGSVAYSVKSIDGGVDASYRVTDCHRAIKLNFTITNESDCEYMLAKVETLKSTVSEFEEALKLAIAHFRATVE